MNKQLIGILIAAASLPAYAEESTVNKFCYKAGTGDLVCIEAINCERVGNAIICDEISERE